MITDGSPEVLAAEAMKLGEDAVAGFAGGHCTSEMLACICEHVTPGMETLETGSGITTMAFLLCGAAHRCVDPQEDKAETMHAVFLAHGGDEATPFLGFPDKSIHVLPMLLKNGLQYDFALMDGKDTFPDAVIDALFMAQLVKPGGHLLVDDKDQEGIRIGLGMLARLPDWLEVKHLGRSVLWERTA